ncbi:MAG: hypothetical protein AAGD38_05875 [Acidobacteriota bacterium]
MTALLCTLLLAASFAQPAAQRPTLVDRIVAVVDEDPILYSDLDRAIALGSVEVREDETRFELERRVLDGLIDQRLQLHAIERYGAIAVPSEAVTARIAALREPFASDEAFAAHLATLELDETKLHELILRQLRVVRYIEERLAPRVFVDLDEIEAYYDGPFRLMIERMLDPMPPLAEVRDGIRILLEERRLDDEISGWTEDLRDEAQIVDLLERSPKPLPPVIERIE